MKQSLSLVFPLYRFLRTARNDDILLSRSTWKHVILNVVKGTGARIFTFSYLHLIPGKRKPSTAN